MRWWIPNHHPLSPTDGRPNALENRQRTKGDFPHVGVLFFPLVCALPCILFFHADRLKKSSTDRLDFRFALRCSYSRPATVFFCLRYNNRVTLESRHTQNEIEERANFAFVSGSNGSSSSPTIPPPPFSRRRERGLA